MKILIYGPGWIGTQLATVYKGILSKTDICDYKQIKKDLKGIQPDVVINAAGKTSGDNIPNIDWCEKNKEETAYSNIAGVLVLAKACKESNVRFVHLSSGCIYDMRDRVTEEDRPTPVSFYGVSKATVDEILTQFNSKPLILRLRMPFDSSRHPKNLITKIARYTRVTGLPNSMTFLPDLFFTMAELLKKGRTGLFNVTNPQPISHWETLELYKRYVDPDFQYERITKNELHSFVKAKRTDVTLSTYKLQAEGIILPPAIQRMEEAIKQYAQGVNSAT